MAIEYLVQDASGKTRLASDLPGALLPGDYLGWAGGPEPIRFTVPEDVELEDFDRIVVETIDDVGKLLRYSRTAASGLPPPPPPPPAVTLDPARKGPGLTLSNGNLTVIRTGDPTWQTVLATLARPVADAGGFYFEVYTTVVAAFARIGFAVTAIDLSGTQYIGMDGNSQGEASDGGNFGAGELLGFFMRAGKWFFRRGATWQNGDPDAGGAGTALSIGPDVFPALSIMLVSDRMDINLGGSAFGHSVPVGGSAWGAA